MNATAVQPQGAHPLDGRLIVPTNWQQDLLERVLPYKPAYLYGSLPDEATVRSSAMLQVIDDAQAERHVAAVRRAGAGFTYVMNASCLGNREFTDRGREELIEQFHWIRDMGATAIVTPNPTVLRMIKDHVPGVEAHVSVVAYVNTPRAASFFSDMGADVIHLDPSVNRNGPLLEAIRRSAGCRLSVLVNHGCLAGCAMRQYHSNVMSHSHASIHGGSYVDYCYTRCSWQRNVDPVELLRANWIRPEDTRWFLDAGIDYLKLGGREKVGDGFETGTDAITFLAKSYHEQHVDNLWDLLISQLEVAPTFAGVADTSARRPHVYIDNAKLDGFFEYFRRGHCDLACGDCQYCPTWAKKTIRIDGDAGPYINRLYEDMETCRRGSYRTGVT